MRKTIALIFASLLFSISTAFCSPEITEHWGECTTVLAAGNATSDGSIILAKNRDLSEYEVQWLYRAPRQSHPLGTTVKLQYIEIPQINVTWAWVGSKSYTKKWGVGMGINEWGVVVADNDAPTREPLEGERGLHDNDICRLILERSKTAQEGTMVAGALIEEYGHANVGQIYWVADPNECWIVECAGHHWAAVRITDGVAVRANQFQITIHWDAGSEDLVEYAVQKGWCGSAEDSTLQIATPRGTTPTDPRRRGLRGGTNSPRERSGTLTERT
jgi:secernin